MAKSFAGIGNGVNGSILGVTIYDLAELSPNISIANLTSGILEKWGGDIGQSVALTFSFNLGDGQSTYIHDYDVNGSNVSLLATGLNSIQKDLARLAMQSWANVANISFTQVYDSEGKAGDFRWANTTDPDVQTALVAEFPSTVAEGGDVWIGPDPGYVTPVVGKHGYGTFIHELGHGLGLNHPHHSDASTPPLVRDDQVKYSVMSYRDFEGDIIDGYTMRYHPTTPMLNDILAIQWLYGANLTHNADDTTYSWGAGQSVYETIWDAGGDDTISAASQTQGSRINLNSGEWSEIGVAFYNGLSNVRDTLTIAYGAVIENAIGSQFNDALIGNAAANKLIGADGDDMLDGGAGADQLRGGLGNDTYVVDHVMDLVYDFAGQGTDTVLSSISYQLGKNVENLTLTAAGFTATGNLMANVLTAHAGGSTLFGGGGDDMLHGAAGDDVLDGGFGKDTLRGGMGDDVYLVGTRGDVVIELADQGIDTVNSSVNWDLADNLENLNLVGSANIYAKGNSLNNVLTGNSGDNLLDANGGSDRLIGGAGSDTYLLQRDHGQSVVVELLGDSGVDTIQLGVGVRSNQLWFSRVGDALQATIIGTEASLVVEDWYSAGMSVESFRLHNGSTLAAADVENLVSAMAMFDAPSMGMTSLSTQQNSALSTLISSHWVAA